jgi:hypothetical protein
LKDLVMCFGAAVTPPCYWLRSRVTLVDNFLVLTLARMLRFWTLLELTELMCFSGLTLRRGDNVCTIALFLLPGVSFC